MTKEIWKDLPMQGKRSKYQVSNMGNIRKIHLVDGIEVSYRPVKVLVDRSKNRKCVSVSLRDNGKQRNYYVSRLVALHFVDNPNNYNVVKHIDGNFENNAASNLKWVQNSHGTTGYLFGVQIKKVYKIMYHTINWLYDKLSKGEIECKDTKALIEDYKATMGI